MATCPKDVPYPIDDCSIFSPWTTGALLLRSLGKFSFNDAPQWAWHPKVIYVFGFCDILALAYFAPRWLAFLVEHYFPRGAFIF